jgi:putative colanic acid biosynthesis acetyltransferase WcaF
MISHYQEDDLIRVRKDNEVLTDLSRFSTGNYKAGPSWKVILWYPFNYFVFNSSIPWPYGFKARLLRLFGARVGKNVIIKNRVRIKNPWRFSVGSNSWIGEDVWIDNLEDVELGRNVCLSQGAVLLTGNHDYTVADFPYRLGKIQLHDGVWIGAQSVVCPGTKCGSHSILTVNSVASKSMMDWGIYSGNPAKMIRSRKMH